jgi:predicted ArsR family transcriptional regulator
MDRHKKFARNWKSIAVVSKMKWRARGDEINALILSMMQDAFGDKALDVIADAHYQIGLKDGARIASKLHIAGSDSAACLAVIEALSILAGVNSEFTENADSIRLMGCPFAHTLQLFHPFVCSYYAQGLVKAVNEDAQVRLVKGMCEGDKLCEFTIESGYRGKREKAKRAGTNFA